MSPEGEVRLKHSCCCFLPLVTTGAGVVADSTDDLFWPKECYLELWIMVVAREESSLVVAHKNINKGE